MPTFANTHDARSVAPPELRCTLVEVGSSLVAVLTARLELDASGAALTTAEAFVMNGIFAGESNEAIARLRGRSPRTVANQVASIFRKRGVGSRAELVACCRALASSPATSPALTFLTEAEYARGCEDEPWLARVLHATTPVLDTELARVGISYVIAGEEAERLRASRLAGTLDTCGALEEILRGAPTALRRSLVSAPWAGAKTPLEGTGPSRDHALSARQREIVARAATGQSNKLIALELGLAPSTVAGHLTRAARKLGVRSRIELLTTLLRIAC